MMFALLQSKRTVSMQDTATQVTFRCWKLDGLLDRRLMSKLKLMGLEKENRSKTIYFCCIAYLSKQHTDEENLFWKGKNLMMNMVKKTCQI